MFGTIWRTTLRAGVVLGFAASGFSVPARQFSGDLVRTDAGSTSFLSGKLYVSHDKVRIETFEFPGGFFLVLADANSAHFVRPTQKTLMDAMQSSQLSQMFIIVDPEDPCTRWQAMAQVAGVAAEGTKWRCERLNDEIINGRRAAKFRGASPKNREYFAWIDPELRFPVRLQDEDEAIVDLANIHEAPQAESLFVVPTDYLKFDPQQLIDRLKHSDVWVEQAR
jgi:hypothetical protein